MRLTVPSIEVQAGTGFEQDLLQRESFGAALHSLVKTASDSLVISLDAPWGEGKTTFVRMWQDRLQLDGIPSVIIDTFVSDYIDDPFISIAGAIIEYIDSRAEGGSEERAKELQRIAATIGSRMLSSAADSVISWASLGLLDKDQANALRAELAENTNPAEELNRRMVERRFERHQQEIEEFAAFKTLLSGLAADLSPKGDKPFVVILDELDRCRPDHAIRVIEIIKHLFSVPRIVFVLALDKSQLEASVRRIYGEIDARQYLQKFINIESRLPRPTEEFDTSLENLCARLVNAHEFPDTKYKGLIVHFVSTLGRYYELPLRGIERAVSNIAVCQGLAYRNDYQCLLVSCLAVVKTLYPQVIDSFIRRPTTGQTFMVAIKLDKDSVSASGIEPLEQISAELEFFMSMADELEGLPQDDRLIAAGRRFPINENGRRQAVQRCITALTHLAASR